MLINLKMLLLSVCLLPSLAFANFTVAPVNLVINKDQKIAALTLRNNTDQPRSFQLTAFKIDQHDKHEVDTLTKDIIVTPLRFRLAPGKTQTVRVAIKNEGTYPIAERLYRISVKELPRKLNKEGAHVQVVTEFKIPVAITDKSPESELKE